MDKRLGFHDPHGQTMPQLTVSGRPYNASSAPAQHGLGHGYFVVLDADGAPDEAVLAELRALVTPKATPADAKGKTKEKPNES